jgi:hypothetical protein
MNIRFCEVYIPACALRLDHGDAMLRLEGLASRFRPIAPFEFALKRL